MTECDHEWVFSDELATPTKCKKCGSYLPGFKITKLEGNKHMEAMTHVEVKMKDFNLTDSTIEEMKRQYLPLKIDGIQDKAGYIAVREARMKVKSARIEVEKTRKSLKEDALAYGRKVDGEAKRITALLIPIETHLETQESAVDAEKERLKAEKDKAEKDRLNKRLQILVGYGIEAQAIDIQALGILSDEAFDSEAARARGLWEEKQKALEVEQAAKTLEAEKMAKIAAEQETERLRLAAIDKEQKEIQARIQADKDAAEAKLRADQDSLAERERAFKAQVEKAAEDKLRAEEMEVAKIEAAKKALKDAEDAARHEAWVREEQVREEKRLAALRPDGDKLMDWAGKIQDMSAQIPNLIDSDAKAYAHEIHLGLLGLAELTRECVKKLQKPKTGEIK